jgi:flagellar hook-basal body complex protein FliE
MIEAIASLTPLADLAAPASIMRPTESGHGFMDIVSQGIGSLNRSLGDADNATRSLAAGGDMPVHDVMLALEHARLDMQFAVQLRNRVVAAYHDIVNMQV